MAAPLLAAIPVIASAAARAIPMVAGAAARTAATAAQGVGASTRVASMVGRGAQMGVNAAANAGVRRMMTAAEQPRESRSGAFMSGLSQGFNPSPGGQYPIL